MVRVRIRKDDEPAPRVRTIERSEEPPGEPKRPDGPTVRASRGLSERQWFIGLLVASGLLLMITFRGCVLPSGVGPKSEPAAKPSSAPAAPATVEPKTGEYTVQGGDNLGKIAEKTGSSVDAIAEANGISRTTILRVGQKLKIP